MGGIVQEIKEKINSFLANREYFTASLLVLVALTSFGLGRQSVVEEGESRAVGAVESHSTPPTAATRTTISTSTFYVGSVNSDVYHLPHCSGAERISEANKITFESKAAAEAAGYRPAANCEGI